MEKVGASLKTLQRANGHLELGTFARIGIEAVRSIESTNMSRSFQNS